MDSWCYTVIANMSISGAPDKMSGRHLLLWRTFWFPAGHFATRCPASRKLSARHFLFFWGSGHLILGGGGWEIVKPKVDAVHVKFFWWKKITTPHLIFPTPYPGNKRPLPDLPKKWHPDTHTHIPMRALYAPLERLSPVHYFVGIKAHSAPPIFHRYKNTLWT